VDWLRVALSKAEPADALQSVSRHFLQNEAGFTADKKVQDPVSKSTEGNPLGMKTLTVASGNPLQPAHPLRRLIQQKAALEGVDLRWINHGKDDYEPGQVDVFIQGARHENGRQIWMQDVLHFKPLAPFLAPSAAKPVIAALERISQLSSSTIPIDNETLQNLERAASQESILVPVARYHIALFSHKDAPLELVHTPQDEFTFRRRQP
jgi:hypothetical protein